MNIIQKKDFDQLDNTRKKARYPKLKGPIKKEVDDDFDKELNDIYKKLLFIKTKLENEDLDLTSRKLGREKSNFMKEYREFLDKNDFLYGSDKDLKDDQKEKKEKIKTTVELYNLDKDFSDDSRLLGIRLDQFSESTSLFRRSTTRSDRTVLYIRNIINILNKSLYEFMPWGTYADKVYSIGFKYSGKGSSVEETGLSGNDSEVVAMLVSKKVDYRKTLLGMIIEGRGDEIIDPDFDKKMVDQLSAIGSQISLGEEGERTTMETLKQTINTDKDDIITNLDASLNGDEIRNVIKDYMRDNIVSYLNMSNKLQDEIRKMVNEKLQPLIKEEVDEMIIPSSLPSDDIGELNNLAQRVTDYKGQLVNQVVHLMGDIKITTILEKYSRDNNINAMPVSVVLTDIATDQVVQALQDDIDNREVNRGMMDLMLIIVLKNKSDTVKIINVATDKEYTFSGGYAYRGDGTLDTTNRKPDKLEVINIRNIDDGKYNIEISTQDNKYTVYYSVELKP